LTALGFRSVNIQTLPEDPTDKNAFWWCHVHEEEEAEEEDGKEADEEEEEEENEDEVEDDNDDAGKEPRIIGQGMLVTTSADDVDTMADDQPNVRPQLGKEMCKHTWQLQTPAPATRPQTTEHCPQPVSLEPDPPLGASFYAFLHRKTLSWWRQLCK